MAKISVVVPIYNVEKYLRECLDSILAQTFSDLEIICVNDGSTDSSASILEEYKAKDARIVVINKANSGYGHTMNTGFAAASANYIGIVESDDFIDKHMYQKLFDVMVKNDCDIVKSNWYFYWTKNNKKEKCKTFEKCKLNKVIEAKDCKEIFEIQPSVWTGLYKKSFLDENSIKFLETPGASYQDTSFTFKVMMAAKKIFLMDECLLYYRQDNMNSSIKSKDKVYNLYNEYVEIYKFLEDKQDFGKEFLPILQSFEYHAHIGTWMRIDKKFKDEYFDFFTSRIKELNTNNNLGDEFFTLVKKKDFDLLINSPNKFKSKIIKSDKKARFREFRKNIFSLKIKHKKLNIKLFGKQLVG